MSNRASRRRAARAAVTPATPLPTMTNFDISIPYLDGAGFTHP